MSDTKSCETCEFFFPFPNGNGVIGACRRRAPTPVVLRYVTGNGFGSKGEVVQVLDGIVDGFFPSTNAKLYCGEYVQGRLKEPNLPGEIPPPPPDEEGRVAGFGLVEPPKPN